jgi:prepilin-type N-terminal cleavage/methylation domain-containing protein
LLLFLFFSFGWKGVIMRRKQLGQGFTLVELLVVIAIIGILVALLLPAIQAAREAARRTQCNNNLKNITLGLQNYHDTYKEFPAGAIDQTSFTRGRVGPSWWYGILPFMEQRNVYDKLQNRINPAPGNTQAATATQLAVEAVDAVLGQTLRDLKPGYMKCPSSPLPVTEMSNGPIMLPSYVGIQGGDDIYATNGTRTYQNRHFMTPAGGGVATASGMLTPCESQNIASCRDGTSNTMVVAEAGDWLSNGAMPGVTTKYHGDYGWYVAGQVAPTGQAPGWLPGTDQFWPIRSTVSGGGGQFATSGQLSNLTTVRWQPQKKDILGGVQQNVPGLGAVTVDGVTNFVPTPETIGHNNPIQSAHPGGLLVALVDGSVQFMAQTVDVMIARRVAIRDDGQNIGEW